MWLWEFRINLIPASSTYLFTIHVSHFKTIRPEFFLSFVLQTRRPFFFRFFTFFFNLNFLFTEFVLIVWIVFSTHLSYLQALVKLFFKTLTLQAHIQNFFLRGCVFLKSDFNSDYLFLSPISTAFIIINANLKSIYMFSSLLKPCLLILSPPLTGVNDFQLHVNSTKY